MAERRTSIAPVARTQSASGPPTQEFVQVAVLPPRLPPGMAPPTGLGPADAFSWDESINWRHNEKIDPATPEQVSRMKGLMRKSGLTTQRKKANEDMPPFMFKKVPYDVWRKHYAKDKDGRYRGTDTPAEDCLLLPEDVEKWRLGDPETKADLWTRGKEALPVYDEAKEPEALPAYAAKYDGPPPEELRLGSVSSNASSSVRERQGSTFTAGGKTSAQIIAEAKEKHERKKLEKGGWKNTLKRAGEYSLMGSGS